jgi:predicted nucleic acid-binding protein
VTYLLDTNVVSELGRSRPHPGVRSWYQGAPDDSLHLSVLVLGEIRHGIERLRPRDPLQASKLERWLTVLEAQYARRTFDVDSPIAHAWGRINAGDPVPAVDGIIAATALVHGLVVVTRDTRPFERIGVPYLDPWTYGEP